jgi:hypothetical protein
LEIKTTANLKATMKFTILLSALLLASLARLAAVAADSADDLVMTKIDWPAFMRQHNMTFDKLPSGWTEAPHFGNAIVGSMLYRAGDNPCIESTLGMANIVQAMLIQSWSDPAKDESGPIRIFPALPSTWQDVEFRDLRAEGAFLVSAKRSAGQTQWVKIRSLAGEPCRLRPGIDGEISVKGDRQFKRTLVSPGIYQIDLKQGEEVLLQAGALPAMHEGRAK